jgi:hypothetical protein
MNDYLKKFRAQYPEYGDMSDAELARALHIKFYADMSYPEFAQSIGLDPKAEAQDAAEIRLASGGNPVTDFLHMAAEGATFGQADRLAGILPGGQSREQFQQRTDDLQMLAPGASAMAAAAPVAAMGGAKLLGGGLTRAVDAVRIARGGTPPLRAIHTSPLQALRTLAANHPTVAKTGGTLLRRTAAGLGLGSAFEMGRRIMPGK